MASLHPSPGGYSPAHEHAILLSLVNCKNMFSITTREERGN